MRAFGIDSVVRSYEPAALVIMIAPSGPSMMERSPSAGTSLTVMAERLVVVAGKEAW